jgi:hypothetical protein
MVTFMAVVIYVFTFFFIVFLDCHYYDMKFMTCISQLFTFDTGIREWYVYVFALYGILHALFWDLRKKNHKAGSTSKNGE